MSTSQDIIRFIEKKAGHALGADEGLMHGDLSLSVDGVTVAWMATPKAIEDAGKRGHKLLIAHESVYYPYDVVKMANPPEGWRDWKVNQRRRELLDRYGMTCVRVHGTADELTIFDTFVEVLGLGKPVTEGPGYLRVYEIPECSVLELAQRVKRRTGMEGLRVAGDPERLVKRVGLPWGGMGLFVNVGYQQQLAQAGCDVFIAGETDSYGFRFAVESGIPMIETSHEISENPGLVAFTNLLAREFPDIKFNFYENKCIWYLL